MEKIQLTKSKVGKAKTMDAEKKELQEAINRALKAANRALKKNDFEKVADIYYRIAYMMNDLGDLETARKFSEAAKQFKEKNRILNEINNLMAVADAAYQNHDYISVAENYLKISSLAEIFGDKSTSQRFKTEAEKFLEMAKLQLKTGAPKIASMSNFASSIQSQVPSSIQLQPGVARGKSKSSLGYDEALVALGLICRHCGKDIDPDLKKCPNCGNLI